MHFTIRQKEVLTGLIVLALSFGSLLAAESVLRVKQVAAFGTATNVEKSAKYYIDENTGLRLPKPDTKHGTLAFNSLGFRSPEIASAKPPGVVRIAFLGNSTTLDAFVAQTERTWPHLIADALQRLFPDVTVDYLNAGVPGMGSEAMLTYFTHFVSGLSPDIVVVLANDQNSDMDRYVRRHGVHDGTHYRPSWLARHSLFWAKVEKNAVTIQRQRSAFREQYRVNIEPATITARFQERMIALVEAIKQSGAQPILLTYDSQLRATQDRNQQRKAAQTLLFYMPYLAIPGILSVQAAYNDALTAVAVDTGSPLIDWRDIVPGDSDHFVDSVHFTNAGSRLMAAHVVAKMIEKPRIQQRFKRAEPLQLQQ